MNVLRTQLIDSNKHSFISVTIIIYINIASSITYLNQKGLLKQTLFFLVQIQFQLLLKSNQVLLIWTMFFLLTVHNNKLFNCHLERTYNMNSIDSARAQFVHRSEFFSIQTIRYAHGNQMIRVWSVDAIRLAW